MTVYAKIYFVLKGNKKDFGKNNRGLVDSEFVKTCHEHVTQHFLEEELPK